MTTEAKRERPVLGLRPREVAVRERAVEVLEAMLRYAGEGLEVPEDWREELNDLLEDGDAWRL